ncbi:desmoplakin isoform X2 [Clupea harengus]|uniref:Desmoplakin isoform X2 n=1 Tax=Clupea harengus TaxID=7950 RepID=A0A6P8F6T5_CLUHA|nr:desmoplakin isoform X2 [Clupea harengus]
MSAYGGSNPRINTLGRRINSRTDLSGGYNFVGGNGHQTEYVEYHTSKNSLAGGGGGGGGQGGAYQLQRKAQYLHSQCVEALERANNIFQTEGSSPEANRLMAMANECIDQLRAIAMELQSMGQPNENVRMSIFAVQKMMSEIQNYSGTTQRKNRGSIGWDEPSKNFNDAIGWINQQKRLIEKAPFGDDAEAIEQQMSKHNKYHSSLQHSMEVDRARSELTSKGDKSSLHALDQEWETLQKMSHSRTTHLRDLQGIIQEISRAIMWVNEHEEEELVFDWGNKNIDVYIPNKQESYSRLMSELEVKEKDLNKLKHKVDILLKNNHPASDKIEAYMDTLQTQWSWLLQITKCLHVHLKENAAYSQFFKEAGETYVKLQKEHDSIRKRFSCDRSTPLETLNDLLRHLEKEKERLSEHKRQVHTLVNKSKGIIRLKPRNPEEKSNSPVIVEALCDFKQDQKGILKGNEAIMKDNSQRSKWLVTGPGGLEMMIPSVCLIVPPPNPLSIDVANKNEQYYEAISNIWSQLYINIKSLISWQYCVKDINHINSLTLTVLSKMRPEEYRSIIKRLETHYQEFLRNSHGSEMFGDKDKREIESKYSDAQTHYDKLVVQNASQNTSQVKKEVVTVVETPAPRPVVSVLSVSLLSELNTLRRRLEAAEQGLTRQLHVPLKENSVQDCSQRLLLLQGVHHDLDGIRDEYLKLRERILHQLQGADPEQAKYLRCELDIINQKLGSLQGFSTAYLQRLTALRALFQSLVQGEDIIKVHEARLTEKDTSSLDLNENEEYCATLKEMKSELDQKKEVLNAMESELGKAIHWNGQIDHSFHQCDVDLSKYSDLVGQMTDRWRRIQAQIDSRMWDLDKQEKQLKHYQQTSDQLTQWTEDARQRLDTLQAAKFRDVPALMDHLSQHKVLHGEIKGKKEKVENVQKDADTCASSIKDYEMQLASYSAGLETLLNIPIKRTMLHSPTVIIREEAADLQSRYIELLTRSVDYHKYLGELLKNMEELKMRNTKIDFLEEELKRLKDDLQDKAQTNQSLQDSLSRFHIELNQSKEQLITVEEVKRDVTRQCNATKESLDSTSLQVRELNDQLTRLTYQIDEEKRKRRLAEERYTSQQEEYEVTIRKRQKELEELNWAKIDFEKAVKDKEREIERLKRQLEEESAQRKAAESETSKTSMLIHESQTHYNEVRQERDSLLAKLKMLEQDKGKLQKLENELNRIKVSMESELRLKQRLQDELDKMTKDFNYWKSQYEIKERQVTECSTGKDKAERDRSSLLSDVERLKLELRSLEDRYKGKLQCSEREIVELTQRREALEREIRKLQQRPDASCKQTQTDEKAKTVDPSKLVFDGVRRMVSAHQLCDCGIIDKATLDKLLKGQKTVSEVSVDIQLSLKGTGVIAGMVQGSQGRMPFTEARGRNLLSNESAIMLLEAQAATGHILDPKFNEKMSVDAACSRGVVDTEDRDVLITAEAASTGFKDPFSGKLLSVGQAYKKGHVDKETTLRLLQAQESVGGILDPVLSVYLPKDAALDRNLIDEELYRALNKKPPCYLDPDTQQKVTYTDLKKKCRMEPATGILLLPATDKPLTVKGLRGEVSVSDLVDAQLLDKSDVTKLNQGTLTSKDIEDKLKSYLHGSDCIAGIYDEANDRVMAFYQAMKEGLLRRGTTLELLEAQAASGFMIDPVQNVSLTVDEAYKRGLVGKEYKDKLLSAERAVTGYKDPHSGKTISLFQAIEKDLIEKGHGIRLLEAQIASGGIIDPLHSHRIDVDVAYKRGYFNQEMSEILSYEGDDTKGFFDPNSHENLTYLQLKERCIKDPKTGLLLLPLKDKKKQKQQQSTQKNTLRKRRVVIVDPDTGKEMTVREAYHRELIDYETFLELSEQECEWEEITITASDGSIRLVVVDRKTGMQYDVQEVLNKGIIDQATLDRYHSGEMTLTQLADLITKDTKSSELAIVSSSADDVVTCSDPTHLGPSSPTIRKRFASVSITLSPPAEMLDDQSPVAAIFDTETLEKVTIPEAKRRGIIDTITAQRLLEAQVCTGGIINPSTGQRLLLQDAVHQGIIDEDMASKLKPAQKAYVGFEDVKTKRKMSAAEAMKEKWLPYEAGQRFMEFQYLTGGLLEPATGQRVSIEEAIRRGWLDGRNAQKLQDTKSYLKMLTCPKTKLKISYKEAMDKCMVEENMGMKMLQASSMSTKGISSPYNVSSGPSSRSGSRAGSRTSSRAGSRRGSVDYSSAFNYSSFTTSSQTFSSGSQT